MIILLSFQIIYGYLFYKLGVLIAFFMIGLSLGGFAAVRLMRRVNGGMRLFIKLQCSTCFYIVILPLCLRGLSGQTSMPAYWFGSNVIFIALSFIPGFISGASFAVANEIYFSGQEKTGQAAGAGYSMDLLGSALGALLTALFIIPLLEIFQACWALAVINFAALGMLILASLRRTSFE
jgi:hypothetical protein